MQMGENDDADVEDVQDIAMDVGNEEDVVVENNILSTTSQSNLQSLPSRAERSGLGIDCVGDLEGRAEITRISARTLVPKRSGKNGMSGGEKTFPDFLEIFKLTVSQESERRREGRERREEERKEECARPE